MGLRAGDLGLTTLWCRSVLRLGGGRQGVDEAALATLGVVATPHGSRASTVAANAALIFVGRKS